MQLGKLSLKWRHNCPRPHCGDSRFEPGSRSTSHLASPGGDTEVTIGASSGCGRCPSTPDTRVLREARTTCTRRGETERHLLPGALAFLLFCQLSKPQVPEPHLTAVCPTASLRSTRAVVSPGPQTPSTSFLGALPLPLKKHRCVLAGS